MRIGIDIDGVLTNLEQYSVDYLTKYCVENNIKYDIVGDSYNLTKSFNIEKGEEEGFWKKYLENYAIYEKARPFAAEVIQKLKDEGNEIYIITARWFTNRDDDIGENMRKIVKRWLEENRIVYDKLVFTKEAKEKKVEEILENKIDIMIEDSPKNIADLSKITKVICYHSNYNKDCEGERITRCYSWYDIYRYISKL